MLGAALRGSPKPPAVAFRRCSSTSEPTLAPAAAANSAAPSTSSSAPSAAAAPPSTRATKKPRIRLGAVSVGAGLAPEPAEAVLRTSLESLGRCYAAGLARNPSLQGGLTTRLVLDENGIVKSASSSGSDLPDAEVIACGLRTIALLRFPKPTSANVSVNQPFLFTPD